MRLILLTLIVLAGCATDPVPVATGIRRGVPAAGPQRVAERDIPVQAGPAIRPHTVLEDMTATARQITIFAKVPTNADVDDDLRKRAAELNADAVVNVRYGAKGAGAVSWNQISGTGQAVRYRE